MTNVSSWDTTDASNNSASPAGFPEGMAPSGVNDSARAVMGGVARIYEQLDGSLTATGTANAIVVTTNNSHASLGVIGPLTFEAAANNSAATTLAVDGLAATAINVNGNACVGGEIVSGQKYLVLYNATNGVFDMLSIANNGFFTNLAVNEASPDNKFHATESASAYAAKVENSHATAPFGITIVFSGGAPNNTTAYFFRGSDTGGSRIIGYSNGGLANYSANNVNLSDMGAKSGIRADDDHTDFVKQLSFKKFKYKDGTDELDGLIAQDVERIDPSLVTNFADTGLKGIYTERVQQRINSIIPKLIDRIETLEAQIAALSS